MDKTFGPISLMGLILLGSALLWVMHLVYGLRRKRSDDVLRLVLNIAAWVMIIVGILGASMQVLLFFAPIGCAIILGILAMVVTRYRALERRSLLWCLSIAARKGIPLDEAAISFAMERPDEIGIRTQRLAELLRTGMALPDALDGSRTRLPIDALLAVRVGTESGNLSASMRKVARLEDDMDFLVRSMFEKYFYLAFLVFVVHTLTAFMMMRIVPMFAKIFDEFGIELPRTTEFVIAGADWLVQIWFLSVPLAVILVVSFIIGILYYVDLMPRDLPVVNRLTRRVDGANVMRVLALAVEQNWPIGRTVWMLSRVYPKYNIRNRLEAAGERINDGEEWSDCLCNAGLISGSDAAVFQAAQRVGNLQWALDEMADSAIRRLTYRLRFWLNVLFPVILVITGVLIGVLVIGLFWPLVGLIEGLV